MSPTDRSALEAGLALVGSHYRQELCQAIKAALGVIASLSLKGRDHCLVLVFEGASGRGKSIIVRVLMPDSETERYLVRADDFTPASFVSHAANRTSDALAQIDLLPRIKEKVMLTKELAPLFRSNDDELRKNFARLTSVLDGDGYMSNSGTHGERGYTGRYVFNWIGATTPIPQRTHEIMAQLGNRILFYEVIGDEFSEEDLMEFARTYESNDAVEQCRTAVSTIVHDHFQRYRVDSVEPETIAIGDDLLLEMVRYAKLITQGRVEVLSDSFEAGAPEGPHRVILLIQTLARGLALLERRLEVTAEDMDVIRHIAFSSIPFNRRELLRAIVGTGGTLNSTGVGAALGCSKPTALTRMRELAATGICDFQDGVEARSVPASISLSPEWAWLDGPYTPLSDSGVCEQTETSAAH